MNIAFERPLFLLLALLAIPLLLFIARFFRPLFALHLPLGPPGGIAFKPPFNLNFLTQLLRSLELAGVFLLLVAAAGPRFVHNEVIWLSRGADIIFAIDISPSMSGIDMDGRNRFDAAKSLLKEFAERRVQDAIGLIAFGIDAAIITPLTTDRQTLFDRLDTLALGEMGDGTAIGTGLTLAAFHISHSQAPRQAVVLITDGENNAGSVHPETAAAALKELGVALWVIGVGGSGIVPFSYVDPFTNMLVSGTFESHFDPENLNRIALSGGGTWIHAPTADAFTQAFANVDQGEMVVYRSGIVRRENPFHGALIITSVFIFFLTRFVKLRLLGAAI
ncbi:MAG: VWA domain-containing protein [Treponema sp.]|nr:VWA domain-containing protein [Treponema sp.]